MNRLFFLKKCFNLVQLARINQPIGFFLLLWPTLWGLWLSYRGIPDISVLMVFIIGVLCMRSVGCIINDYVDCEIDQYVQRTKIRPLSSGRITKKEALLVLVVLLVIALVLVLSFNFITICLSLVALVLSVIYPYMKRYTYFPQVLLGILFSWPILMTFTAINRAMSTTAWLMFMMNIMWTIVYDTQYAMMDREDDKKIGVKSFAILFENMDRFIIGLLQLFIIFTLSIVGWMEQFLAVFYFCALFGVVILFIWQQMLMNQGKKKYLKVFLSNNYVGMLIFLGIASDLFISLNK